MKFNRPTQFRDSVSEQWINLTGHRCAPDWVNPTVIALLSILGLAFIYSVQSQGFYVKWKFQATWITIGFACYYLVSCINYKMYMQFAHWFYIVAVFLLLLLWTPLGKKMGGSLRWLQLGPLYVQPSDPCKLATLILTASILARNKVGSFKDSIGVLTKVVLACVLPCFFIFIQPDLGSSLVFPPMVFALLFMSRLSLKFFAGVFLLCLFMVTILAYDMYGYYRSISNDTTTQSVKAWYVGRPFLPLKPYQRNRILAFIAPQVVDPQGVNIGWHLKQSLIAVGSGGFWGKGWTKNTQAQLGYLPKAASFNDFIFSVAAEEIGFVGTSVILLLYVLLIVNSLRVAGLSKDRFGCYLAVGVSILLLTHIWINVGMTVGLMPITGIPLPFLSYGGSFIIICFLSLGIVQSVYRFQHAPL